MKPFVNAKLPLKLFSAGQILGLASRKTGTNQTVVALVQIDAFAK